MRHLKTFTRLVTVISLLLGVIWLSSAAAVGAPGFSPGGQVRADGMYVPGAIDLDGEGNLYVADGRSGHVYVFDKYGDLVSELDLGASGRGLAVTSDGSKLLVAREASVVSYDFASGESSDFLAGFDLVGEIDFDDQGNVYVVDVKSMMVNVYTDLGQPVTSFGGEGFDVGQFKQIGGMSVNGGQVYVTDQAGDNGQVHVFTLDPVTFAVTGKVAYPRTATGLWTALGLTFDDSGRVYVVDYVKSAVRVYQPDMSKFQDDPVVGEKGRDAGELSDVNDVIFDTVNSRLFVSCGSRIEVFGVDGGSSPTKPVNTNHAPTAPVTLSPSAGSEVDTLNPVLVIGNSEDPDGDAIDYNVAVYLGQDIVFQGGFAAQEGETTSVLVNVDLVENGTYSWTVQATDGALSSDVSVAAGFVVNAIEEAPGVPVISSPNAGELVDGSAEFSWSATEDPDPKDDDVFYQVTMAQDALFEQIVAVASGLSDTTLILESLADYGNLVNGEGYHWRVVALDADGTSSAPSDSGQFVYSTTSLTVSANVPGAEVFLYGNHAYAGEALGEAPVELRDVTPGALSVVVERTGFEPYVASVSLEEDGNIDLYAELVPAMEVKKLSASRNGINGRSGLSVSGDAVPFLVDFDNDGDLDLLVGDADGQLTLFGNMQVSGSNRLYFDQASFDGLPSVSAGAVPFVADWNNDGRKDLIVGDADGQVTLFMNGGTEQAPAFDQGADLLGVASSGLDAAPAVIDFNTDGMKDLVVAYSNEPIKVFLNTGTDAEPVLAAGSTIDFGTGVDSVMPVDWDADGQLDLAVSSGGVVTVYSKSDDAYQASVQFSDRRAEYVAAFPIALDGSGKQILVGQADGQLVYLTGNSTKPVASFQAALLDKVDELADLAGAEYAGDVSVIRSLVDSGDYVLASEEVTTLISKLDDEAALQSAMELLALL